MYHTINSDPVWEGFFVELCRVETAEDVRQLLRAQPLPGEPGRKYYCNLSQFIQFFTVPAAAAPAELAQYLRIIRRLGHGLGIAPALMDVTEVALMREIEARYAAICGSPLSAARKSINNQIREQIEILRRHVHTGNLDLEFVLVHAQLVAQLSEAPAHE